MMFVMLFDAPYFFWTELLMRSIYYFESEAKIHICGVELPDAVLDRFRKMRNVVGVKNYRPQVNASLLRHLSLYDRGLTTVIHLRAFVLSDIMNRFKDEDLFLITDVDMVLTDKLTNLKKQMSKHDAAFNIVKDGEKIMAGTVVIKNNDNGRRFVETWKKYSTENKTNSRVDQVALKEAYGLHKNKMKFLNLSKKYLDHTLHSDTYIWSAHKSYAGGFAMKLHFFQEYVGRIESGENLNHVKYDISQFILEVVRNKNKLLEGRKVL